MAEIVIVQAELGETLVQDGTYPGLMVGGPADDVVADLPAWGRYTPAAVRLTVEGGGPETYFRSAASSAPGASALYCWDWQTPPGVDERSVAWLIAGRLGQLARHRWPDGPYAVPARSR